MAAYGPTSIAYFVPGQLPECFLMERLCTDAKRHPQWTQRVREAFISVAPNTMVIDTNAIDGRRACASQRNRPTATIKQRDAERIVLY